MLAVGGQIECYLLCRGTLATNTDRNLFSPSLAGLLMLMLMFMLMFMLMLICSGLPPLLPPRLMGCRLRIISGPLAAPEEGETAGPGTARLTIPVRNRGG